MSIAQIVLLAFIGLLAFVSLGVIKWILGLRRVVPPGEVHIVQSKAQGRVTYGKLPEDMKESDKNERAPNTYYEWPVWLPHLGVQVSEMDLSVFDQKLEGYKAYDSKRAPFVVDVMAFYRIADPQLAADRIKDMETLHTQLNSSLKSAIRKILAEHPIDEIMQGRSEFGAKFTHELDDDLKAWGVKTVKNVELMDIRDDEDEEGAGVISAIQARHTSYIKKESRIEVANNTREAEEAEIQARRQVDLQRQDALRQVGEREAQTVKLVGIAKQQSEQEVAAAEKETTVARMEVKREEAERHAEIQRSTANIRAKQDKEVAEVEAQRDKNVALVQAEKDKSVKETIAEADKNVVVKTAEAEKERLAQVAEGRLVEATKAAEGVKLQGLAEGDAIRAKGVAEGDAARAKAMAPVEAELKLVEGIGSNKDYQDYMVRQRTVDAGKEVGIAQAEAMGEALKAAKIKVLSNTGGGASSLGNQLGGLMEGFALTDMGRSISAKIGILPSTVANEDSELRTPDSDPTGSGVKRVKRPMNGADSQQ